MSGGAASSGNGWAHAPDIVAFVHAYRSSAHGRQQLEGGQTTAAAETIRSIASHISTLCELNGRHGEWRGWEACHPGNPARSQPVRNYVAGNANALHEAGVEPKHAKAISAEKVAALVQALEEEADKTHDDPTAEWQQEAVLRRDAAVVQLLWDSKRRPSEATHLQPERVEVTPGKGVVARAISSKMTHASRGQRRPRPIQVAGEPGRTLAGMLQRYIDCLSMNGKQLGSFLFCPLRADRTDFDYSRRG